MAWTIREAKPDDAATLAEFNCRMAQETEGRTLPAGRIRAGVDAVLADSNKGRYWVAVEPSSSGGRPEIIGQIMVTREWSDWRNGNMWWIQSVYVPAEQRRRGVFSALYRHVESLARDDPGACGLRLYVERENNRARRTYRSLGMGEPGYLVMEVDFTAQTPEDGSDA